jgi:hypothetical protein
MEVPCGDIQHFRLHPIIPVAVSAYPESSTRPSSIRIALFGLGLHSDRPFRLYYDSLSYLEHFRTFSYIFRHHFFDFDISLV